MAKDQHIIDGAWAEQMAVTYLSQTDYQLLERNWRYKRAEIDLVCSLKGKLVLIEVKYRKADYFGEPEGAVEDLKQKKMQEAIRRSISFIFFCSTIFGRFYSFSFGNE